ncbi:MAG: Flp pilus assembly protein CpaB [Caenibius sp.]
MGGRNLIILAIAIGLGLIAVVLANAYFSGMEKQQARLAEEQQLARIVVATQPLEFGSPLTKENLTLKNWPANSVPVGAFTDLQAALQDGRVALRPIVPGEPVLADKVSGAGGRAVLASNLPEGMRAVSIPISAVSGVSGFARPGDTVDILLTRKIPGDGAGNEDMMSDVVLDNVQLLAIDQSANEKDTGAKVGKTATVQVDLLGAQKLAIATNVGTLSLALRNVENQLPAYGPTVTTRDLGGGGYYIPGRPSGPAMASAPSGPVYSGPVAPPRPTGPVMAVFRGTEKTDYEVSRLGRR